MTSFPQFFVVWNPSHGLPRYQHDTHDAAKEEAHRLARQHPGQTLYVMVATGKAELADPVKWTPSDEIPF